MLALCIDEAVQLWDSSLSLIKITSSLVQLKCNTNDNVMNYVLSLSENNEDRIFPYFP